MTDDSPRDKSGASLIASASDSRSLLQVQLCVHRHPEPGHRICSAMERLQHRKQREPACLPHSLLCHTPVSSTSWTTNSQTRTRLLWTCVHTARASCLTWAFLLCFPTCVSRFPTSCSSRASECCCSLGSQAPHSLPLSQGFRDKEAHHSCNDCSSHCVGHHNRFGGS